ncbi:uncharacterized protein BKCO1_4000133 [Diplodia corticola]|uniref:Uncharacterized protein n=1 Tax=Diplodia corticola TaxID=236234 RepID=A0A1J9REX6_9PEZI|nr:uncharacterized protein BKCO1_4000133 [Diplodia corticola]OJD38642.1 hypothetical protein BKCO1_4000133 [Diplodia corticola]
MSGSSANVPDAWDDNWETVADKPDTAPPGPQPPKKLTKAERRAQHAEFNRQLWEAAETPKEAPLFLQARPDAPLKNDVKAPVKVLSRKPPPKILSRGEDDEDSEEEEARKKAEREFAERQARAQQEREEKQRRYAEVRERLFGSSTSDGSQERSASPRGNGGKQFRGKGRGSKGADRGDSDANSSADQSPARGQATPKRHLYDPGYSAKPNSSYVQRQQDGSSRSRSGTPGVDQPIRAPRGPDGGGRAGFGFAPRGGRGSSS